ncbi:uncharacterized protein VTP21DRAFT_1333 [Calcarisporiella thermophila]|uniref:uncharacterized protein n=1 Tax=Calcarisporiella thermophila TaxID=911321 RepID=UPI003742352E
MSSYHRASRSRSRSPGANRRGDGGSFEEDMRARSSGSSRYDSYSYPRRDREDYFGRFRNDRYRRRPPQDRDHFRDEAATNIPSNRYLYDRSPIQYDDLINEPGHGNTLPTGPSGRRFDNQPGSYFEGDERSPALSPNREERRSAFYMDSSPDAAPSLAGRSRVKYNDLYSSREESAPFSPNESSNQRQSGTGSSNWASSYRNFRPRGDSYSRSGSESRWHQWGSRGGSPDRDKDRGSRFDKRRWDREKEDERGYERRRDFDRFEPERPRERTGSWGEGERDRRETASLPSRPAGGRYSEGSRYDSYRPDKSTTDRSGPPNRHNEPPSERDREGAPSLNNRSSRALSASAPDYPRRSYDSFRPSKQVHTHERFNPSRSSSRSGGTTPTRPADHDDANFKEAAEASRSGTASSLVSPTSSASRSPKLRAHSPSLSSTGSAPSGKRKRTPERGYANYAGSRREDVPRHGWERPAQPHEEGMEVGAHRRPDHSRPLWGNSTDEPRQSRWSVRHTPTPDAPVLPSEEASEKKDSGQRSSGKQGGDISEEGELLDEAISENNRVSTEISKPGEVHISQASSETRHAEGQTDSLAGYSAPQPMVSPHYSAEELSVEPGNAPPSKSNGVAGAPEENTTLFNAGSPPLVIPQKPATSPEPLPPASNNAPTPRAERGEGVSTATEPVSNSVNARALSSDAEIRLETPGSADGARDSGQNPPSKGPEEILAKLPREPKSGRSASKSRWGPICNPPEKPFITTLPTALPVTDTVSPLPKTTTPPHPPTPTSLAPSHSISDSAIHPPPSTEPPPPEDPNSHLTQEQIFNAIDKLDGEIARYESYLSAIQEKKTRKAAERASRQQARLESVQTGAPQEKATDAPSGALVDVQTPHKSVVEMTVEIKAEKLDTSPLTVLAEDDSTDMAAKATDSEDVKVEIDNSSVEEPSKASPAEDIVAIDENNDTAEDELVDVDGDQGDMTDDHTVNLKKTRLSPFSAVEVISVACKKEVNSDLADLIQTIYEENQRKSLAETKLWSATLVDMQVYRSIEDFPSYKRNIESHERTRPLLAKYLHQKLQALSQKEAELKRQYKHYYDTWQQRILKLEKTMERKKKKKVDDISLLESESSSPQSPLLTSFRSTRRNAAGTYASDAVRSEAEFLEIIRSLETADMRNPDLRALRTTATVPPMILDENERNRVWFDDRNGLVEDPLKHYHINVEKDNWTEEERQIFIKKYASFPKQFGKIASFLPNKTSQQCVLFYYRNKKQIDFKGAFNSRSSRRKKNSGALASFANKRKEKVPLTRSQRNKGSALLDDIGQANNSRKVSRNNREVDESPSWKATATLGEKRRAGSRQRALEESDTSELSAVSSRRRERSGRRSARSFREPPLPPTPTEPEEEGDEVNLADEEEEDGLSSLDVVPTAVWTYDDRMIAIEAFKEHGQDFEMVARLVGTKTEAQCSWFYEQFRRRFGQNILSVDAGAAASEMEDEAGTAEDDFETESSSAAATPMVHSAGSGGRRHNSSEGRRAAKTSGKEGRARRGKDGRRRAQGATSSRSTAGPEDDESEEAMMTPSLEPSEYLEQEEDQTTPAILGEDEEDRSGDAYPPARQDGKRRRTRVATADESATDKDTYEPQTVPAKGPTRRQTFSSYWSMAEKQEFLRAIKLYGKDWEEVSNAIGSKTATQVRNYFQNNGDKLGLGKIVEEFESRRLRETEKAEPPAENPNSKKSQPPQEETPVMVEPPLRPSTDSKPSQPKSEQEDSPSQHTSHVIAPRDSAENGLDTGQPPQSSQEITNGPRRVTNIGSLLNASTDDEKDERQWRTNAIRDYFGGPSEPAREQDESSCTAVAAPYTAPGPPPGYHSSYYKPGASSADQYNRYSHPSSYSSYSYASRPSYPHGNSYPSAVPSSPTKQTQANAPAETSHPQPYYPSGNPAYPPGMYSARYPYPYRSPSAEAAPGYNYPASTHTHYPDHYSPISSMGANAIPFSAPSTGISTSPIVSPRSSAAGVKQEESLAEAKPPAHLPSSPGHRQFTPPPPAQHHSMHHSHPHPPLTPHRPISSHNPSPTSLPSIMGRSITHAPAYPQHSPHMPAPPDGLSATSSTLPSLLTHSSAQYSEPPPPAHEHRSPSGS